MRIAYCIRGKSENFERSAENTLQKEFDTVPPPEGRKVSVAVYQFVDKTGQRKSQANVANFSTAVTQGAEVFLI